MLFREPSVAAYKHDSALPYSPRTSCISANRWKLTCRGCGYRHFMGGQTVLALEPPNGVSEGELYAAKKPPAGL